MSAKEDDVSTQSQQFLDAAMKGDWDKAYFYLNGLNMYEMLRSLARLPPQTLIQLQFQALQYVNQYNVPRIQYALRVVIERTLPPPPGDLRATGQERTAQEFLDELVAPANLSQTQKFYHGTTLAQAKELMTMDIGVRAVPTYLVQDWWEYTDFGKGFYTHPDESKTLAVVWAKKKARKENTEWGVVRFTLTQKEFDSIGGAP